jgi:hypothetical protein
MTDLQEHGVEALSRYDREIAYGGDEERAIPMSTWLVGNSIAYFTEKRSHCDEPMQQITRFDVARTSNDPSSPYPLRVTVLGTGVRPRRTACSVK